jgi:molybdopterin-containing oxidoreductase family iron-sulfur binding subunit
VFISLEANPSFDLPSDYGFKEALKKVPEVIAMTQIENETSSHAGFLLPVNHAFESWGDFGGRVGVVSLRQPVISPIHDTRQKESLLLTWIEGADKYSDDNYHKYIMNRWQTEEFSKIAKIGSFEKFWYAALHDGFVTFNSQMGEVEHPQIQFNYDALNALKPVSKSGFTVVLANSMIGDGSLANNGWLQEIPHPVSKVVWDNYAAVSPSTAKKMDLKDNDIIEININGRKQTLPVWVQAGTADDLVYTEIGYGREKGGTVGSEVGTNVNVLMSKNSGLSERIFTGAKVSKVEGEHKLVATQEHHALDDDFVKDFHKIRDIIQEGTVKQYKEDPHFLHAHKHEVISITPDIEYPNEKWAMAMDLNKCTGCSLCVAACNVENNVPIVGKEETSKGREMHWIRIDRYFSGTPDEPEASIQPMICQHCDNAPCENVCPVVATTHSPDGLNQMVYNRCVGTRYCANNCPYKVRRFNFFDFREMFEDGYQYSDSLKLMNNPEVTVRARGVMEKCTFCVQRITEARQIATEKGEKFTGAGITTACQEACPADAIVFGNVNDPNSAISKLAKHDLGYHVLEMLNVRPNVTYLAKLRNKHTNGGHGEH